MKLEEAKEILKSMLSYMEDDETEKEAIETVLQALENSISKDKVRKFIEENSYKDTYNFKTVEVNKLYELLEDK